jgi:uncharacterized repeat protein (TIGR01451 family)
MRSALVALGSIAIVTPAAMGVAGLGGDPPGRMAVMAATGPRAHSTYSAAAAAGTPVLGSGASAAAGQTEAGRTEAAPDRAADLRLTVTAPPTAQKGDPFTYTLRVANNGPATPSAVVVRVLLPLGAVRIGAQLPNGVGGEADGRFGQLVLPQLRPGTSLSMSITVKPQQAGTLVNTARITYVEGVRDVRLHPAITTTTRVD